MAWRSARMRKYCLAVCGVAGGRLLLSCCGDAVAQLHAVARLYAERCQGGGVVPVLLWAVSTGCTCSACFGSEVSEFVWVWRAGVRPLPRSVDHDELHACDVCLAYMFLEGKGGRGGPMRAKEGGGQRGQGLYLSGEIEQSQRPSALWKVRGP